MRWSLPSGSLLTRVQVSFIEFRLLELRKANSPALHTHTGSPFLHPHQIVVWHPLEHFIDCELIIAHSVQGRMIASQALCRRKCLDVEPRSFLGWGKAMVMVLEMWIVVCWSILGTPTSLLLQKWRAHCRDTTCLAWPFSNNTLEVGSSEFLRLGLLIGRTLNVLYI